MRWFTAEIVVCPMMPFAKRKNRQKSPNILAYRNTQSRNHMAEERDTYEARRLPAQSGRDHASAKGNHGLKSPRRLGSGLNGLPVRWVSAITSLAEPTGPPHPHCGAGL
jgi:hypothetical protein